MWEAQFWVSCFLFYLEIAAAMDVIIAKYEFVSKGGKLIEKYNVQIVSRKVDEFHVA